MFIRRQQTTTCTHKNTYIHTYLDIQGYTYTGLLVEIKAKAKREQWISYLDGAKEDYAKSLFICKYLSMYFPKYV